MHLRPCVTSSRDRANASNLRSFSDSGSSLVWQIVTVVVALVLLVRCRHLRRATSRVVTIARSSLLNTAVKATVNRDPPAVARRANRLGLEALAGDLDSAGECSMPSVPQKLGTV
jgi:hypothetical protein